MRRDTSDKALAAAHSLVKRAEISKPPVDVHRVAALIGVAEIRLADFETVDACLTPISSGWRIDVKRDTPEARQRFSIAHEIAHILVAQSDVPRFRSPGTTAHHPRNSQEERLCNRVAAEILMPKHLFIREMNRRPPVAVAISHLAELFETSILAASIRYSHLLERPLGIACWHRADRQLIPKHIGGPLFRTFWPRRGSLIRTLDQTSSVIVQAFQSEDTAIGFEEFPGLTGLLAEARAFGEGDWRLVVATVRAGVTNRDGWSVQIRAQERLLQSRRDHLVT